MAMKWLTRAQAKTALGDMPDRTFAYWVTRGVPRRDNKFPWPEILTWILDQRERMGRESARPKDLEEAKQREMAARAELLEMEVAEKRRDLVAIAEYTRVVSDAFARVKAGLDAMPARWAADFTVPCSVAEAQQKLRKVAAEVAGELYRAEDVPDGLEAASGPSDRPA